jgi:hypothetical protein
MLLPCSRRRPADIHVVAGYPEPLVETTDGIEDVPAHGHVAAGNVLRLAVRDEHMDRPAGGAGDAIGNPSLRRRDVRPAHGGVMAAEKGGAEIAKPVRVGLRIVVDIGDDLARGSPQPCVARAREAAVARLDQLDAVLGGYRGAVVRGAIVDHDHLVIRIIEALESGEAVRQGRSSVMGADHDRDPRPRQRSGEGAVGEGVAHPSEGGLGPPPPVGQAKIPILDVVAPAVPFVGPSEDEGTGAAAGKCALDLPGEALRLLFLAVTAAVEANLREQQRPVADHVMQACQVGLEGLPLLEVDVEAGDVGERKLEELRGGIVHVGDQRAGVLALDRFAEASQIVLDPAAAMPADDRGRDLVADGVAEHGGVPGAGADALAHASLDVPGSAAVLEEGHVLLPGETHHDEETLAGGEVEQPGRRHGVDADRVDAICAHLREVALDHTRLGVALVGAA